MLAVLTSPHALAEGADYPAVDCVIQPHKIVDIGSPVSGVIDRVLVDRSEFVAMGQPVAQIEDKIERATVDLAKARTEIDAQLQAETINLHYDGKAKDRIDSLYSRRVIPVENKDSADREAELSSHRLQQVKDLKRVRELEYQRAQKLVEQKVIRSSIDGFVIEQYKAEGEYVEDQPILRIAQLDPLNIEAIMPMKYFGLIQPGMNAEVSPEMPGLGLQQAKVTIVDRVGDAASGTFGVRLEMANPDFSVPAGLKCDVQFLETSKLEISAAKQIPKTQKKQTRTTIKPAVIHDVKPVRSAERKPTTHSKQKFTLGPFESENALQAVTNKLRAEKFSVKQESFTYDTDYVVLLQPNESVSDARLSEAGFKDFFYHPDAPFAGRYSLGFFSGKRVADSFANEAISLGFPAEVVDLPVVKPRWWVDLTLSTDRLEQFSALLQAHGNDEALLQLSGPTH